jgi:RP/EB family microtubule-associated protein
VTKIEQLGSGAAYCQLIDVVHPGKVALAKVNWRARSDFEFVANLKLLQNAFDRAGVKKHVDVERLARAKYADNLEFAQWLKRYFALNCGDRAQHYQP